MDSPKKDPQESTHKQEEHHVYYAKPTDKTDAMFKHQEEQGGQSSFLSVTTAASSFLSRTNESMSTAGLHQNQTDAFFQTDFLEKMETEEVSVEKLSRYEAKTEFNRLRTASTHNMSKINQRIKDILKLYPGIDKESNSENEDDEEDQKKNKNEDTNANKLSTEGMQEEKNDSAQPKDTKSEGIWFHIEYRNGELCIDSKEHKHEKTKPGDLSRFEDKKKVWIKIPFLHLENNDIVAQSQEIFKHLKQVEEVKLDFLGLRENQIYDKRVQPHLEDILSSLFTEKDASNRIPFQKIQVDWDWHQDGGSYLMSFLSKKLMALSNTLEEVRISMKKVLSEDIFKEFLLGLQNVEENLTTFELETYLNSPEDRSIEPLLNLPKVTKCSLRFTCYGEFSSSLLDFIQNSLKTMKSVQDLEIELIMNGLSQESVTRLFESVKNLFTCSVKNLKIIVWFSLDEHAEIEDCLNELVKLAKIKFVPNELTELIVGLDSMNIVQIK